jgi:hypothetical protein
VTKFIPANKIALVRNPPISYQSLYATRLATTAKDSKNLIEFLLYIETVN